MQFTGFGRAEIAVPEKLRVGFFVHDSLPLKPGAGFGCCDVQPYSRPPSNARNGLPSLRVQDLARRLGIGIDRLEKRFRQSVGGSPKQLASLYRLLHAVELHRSGLTLTQTALGAGYADQPHFNRGFRSAIGEPPRGFLESNEYCGSGPNARDEWITLRAAM